MSLFTARGPWEIVECRMQNVVWMEKSTSSNTNTVKLSNISKFGYQPSHFYCERQEQGKYSAGVYENFDIFRARVIPATSA